MAEIMLAVRIVGNVRLCSGVSGVRLGHVIAACSRREEEWAE
jgi:hypothetical protein